jgi:hypothetical protein
VQPAGPPSQAQAFHRYRLVSSLHCYFKPMT